MVLGLLQTQDIVLKLGQMRQCDGEESNDCWVLGDSPVITVYIAAGEHLFMGV